MSVRFDSLSTSDDLQTRRARVGRTSFAVAAFCAEVAVILAVALAVGTGYHVAVYGDAGPLRSHLAIGGIAALVYTLPFVFREEYSVQAYMEGHRDFDRTFIVWNTAFLSLAVLGFLTKSTDLVSRGTLILFYLSGLAAVTGVAALTRSTLVSLIASARIASRRIMLVGPEDEIRRIQADFVVRPNGIRIVATQILSVSDRDSGQADPALQHALATAVDKARLVGVDDVVLLVEWSRTALIQASLALHDFSTSE